ncbi:MAG: NUDIX domain-containing protein, partial [Okeania sp. SIO3C4]|nr:NUDIX domain-containing protein [Okeania sp. SIO3C4]
MQTEVRLRVAVLGLFVADNQVLLLHQMTDPEPNCWDLPGGGLQPEETLME